MTMTPSKPKVEKIEDNSPTAGAVSAGTFVDIVFDGPPGHESGRFVEVENAAGASIVFARWVERADGYWALRLTPHANDLQHIHVAGTTVGKDIDECAQCGQDLRASIHKVRP